MKIIVDADACPKNALQIAMELGKQHQVQVWTVASFAHNIQSENHITTGNSPQEADIKVINTAQAGDIVITQDWGLAAMLLGKQVRCISPVGRLYSDASIDFLLEERGLKARHRKGGGRTKGPAKRTPEDDCRFKRNLQTLLVQGGTKP